MTLSTHCKKASDVALSVVREWWRPISCIGIAGSLLVNGIYIPIITGQAVDLLSLSALVTAVTAAFAVREWGKLKGTAD